MHVCFDLCVSVQSNQRLHVHRVRFLAIRDTGSHIVGQGVRVGVKGGCRFVRGGIVCRLLSAVVQE